MTIFSERHNYSAPDAEITVREDAPEVLRGAIVVLAGKAGMGYETLRKEVCGLLGIAPDTRGNWSEPNVLSEVQNHLEECDWFEVYDVIEGIATSLQGRRQIYGQSKSPADVFADGINKIFRKNGIGWQLLGNRIEFRGSEAFEVAVREGTKELRSAGKNTTANELHEALRDLSRRPSPELSGAVQHGMAALECLAKDLTGERKLTLGDLMKKRPELFPPPLGQAVSQVYGYASNNGRHLLEGGEPSLEEAELIVGLSGVLCHYLGRKIPKA